MPRTFALLLSALLASTAAAADSSLSAAEQAWRYGDTQAAIERLRTVLRRTPDDADARLLLARVLLDAGRGEAAPALLHDRDDPAARAVLAASLLEQDDTEAVLALTETIPATANARERAWLLVSRGHALMALGTLDAAERALREASITDAASARPLIGMAELAGLRGDPDTAAALLEQATSAPTESADAWSAVGDNAWRQWDFDAARRAYSAALTGAWSTWSLRYRRALAAVELGDLTAARQDIDVVQRDAPGFAGTDYVLGRVLLAEGDAGAALEHLETFLTQQPAQASGLYYAAVAHLQLGQGDAAEPLLIALRKSRPQDAEIAGLLARLWLERGDAADAQRLLEPFLSDPTPPRELLNLHQAARLAQGEVAAADGTVANGEEGAASAAGADVTETLLATRLLETEGRAAEAIPVLRALVEHEPKEARVHARLVELLLKTGDPKAAEVAAQAFVTALPKSPVALASRAVVHAALGNADAARVDLSGAVDLDPDYANAALGLAILQGGSEQTAAARRTLVAVLERDPANAAALLLLAQLERGEGGDAAFLERLRAGVAASPRTLAIRALLARALLARGQPIDALFLIQEAPSETSEPGRLLLEAEAFMALDRPQSAVANLRKVAELVPDSAAVQFALAGARLRLGETDAARVALLSSFELPDANLLSAEQLQAMLASLDDSDERARWLADLDEAAPNHPAVVEVQARFALHQGRAAQAVALYQRLLAADPQRTRYLTGLAQALHAADDTAAALALLATAVGNGTADTETVLLLGTLALISGDKQRAIAAYRDVLARSPQHPLAANNLASLLVHDDSREALRLAMLAESVRPDDPAIQDTLGLALLAVGEAAAARQVLARAERLSDDPTIAFHYAQALVAVAEPAAAIERLLPLLNQDFPEAAAARSLHAALSAAP